MLRRTIADGQVNGRLGGASLAETPPIIAITWRSQAVSVSMQAENSNLYREIGIQRIQVLHVGGAAHWHNCTEGLQVLRSCVCTETLTMD